MEPTEPDFIVKCVTLTEGGAKDWGKHILHPTGVTLCGQPTPDAIKYYPILKGDPLEIISKYKVEEWNPTCEKCLQIIDMAQKHSELKKNIN